jgi:hypothetical protein
MCDGRLVLSWLLLEMEILWAKVCLWWVLPVTSVIFACILKNRVFIPLQLLTNAGWIPSQKWVFCQHPWRRKSYKITVIKAYAIYHDSYIIHIHIHWVKTSLSAVPHSTNSTEFCPHSHNIHDCQTQTFEFPSFVSLNCLIRVPKKQVSNHLIICQSAIIYLIQFYEQNITPEFPWQQSPTARCEPLQRNWHHEPPRKYLHGKLRQVGRGQLHKC